MTNLETTIPLTRSSVITAHELVKPYIHYTPVLTNSTITALASTPQDIPDAAHPRIRVWFKCENLQRVGAFKVRGAFHALKRLIAEEGLDEVKKRGVVTHSSGDTASYPSNHAQALALAARTLGVKATIVMPKISTPSKIAGTRGYGAKVIFSGSTSVEREAVVTEVIKETGATLIPPYDHPDIMVGQGTLGLEFQAQVDEMTAHGGRSSDPTYQPKCSFAVEDEESNGSGSGNGSKTKTKTKRKGLDAIITPCGGGGMLSGVALSCEGTGILVFGAEPEFEGADDCKRGLAAGERVERVSTLTVADGLRTPVGVFPWSVISNPKLVKGVYSVTEEQILAALRLVLERMKVVVEPSAVVPLAVALYNEDFRKMVEKEAGEEGWDLGVVFSGGNVSVEALGKMFAVKGEKEARQAEILGKDGSKVAENAAGCM